MTTHPWQPPVADCAIPPAEQRLGPLVGDRFCAACGFNLVAQTIVREPHYSMLMVRCPECGSCAALQEYPALGPWAARWSRVLAVALLVVLLGSIGASSLLCWGMSIPAVEAMSRPLRDRIGAAHAQWQLERAQAAAAVPVPSPPPPSAPGGIAPITPTPANVQSPTAMLGSWTEYIDAQWVRQADMQAVLSSQGGLATAIDWSQLGWIVPASPGVFALGVLFSVLLLGSSRRKASVVVPVVLGLSTAWAAISLTDGALKWGGSAMSAAVELVGLRLHLVVYVFFAQIMLLGVWLGRPIARVVVRMLLPPRLCGSLADLWLCEGLEPPYGAVAWRNTRRTPSAPPLP